MFYILLITLSKKNQFPKKRNEFYNGHLRYYKKVLHF